MLGYSVLCLIAVSVHLSLAAGYHYQLRNEDGPTRRSWELGDLKKIQGACAGLWLVFAGLAALVEVGR